MKYQWSTFFIKALETHACDVPLILRYFGIDTGQLQVSLLDALEDFKTGNTGKPIFFSPVSGSF